MFQNLFKTAVRHLRKQAGYAAINVAGLAIGLACCLLIVLYVTNELSFDRFHEHADRIVRVETEFVGKGRGSFTDGVVGPSLVETFPEIEAAVRFSRTQHLVRYEDRQFYGARIAFVDANVFDVFSFELLRGDPETALVEPYSLVLTETMARTYFGDADPVGQVLHIDNADDYTVTGVVADVPPNSHYVFDALGAFSTLPPKMPWLQQRGSVSLQTYALLRPGTDLAALDARMPAYAQEHYADGGASWIVPRFRPLTEIHLHSNTYELEAQNDIQSVYLFSTIAAFILLLACINYMNLATARGSRRMKEVGLRKVMGAGRGQLILQFLGESVLLTLVALALAVGLVFAARPVLADFVGRPLAFDAASGSPGALLLLLAGCLGVGVLAGTYPAFYLTRFQPAAVLKGTLHSIRAGAFLRKALVVTQFVVSIALLVSTLVVYRQLQFMRAKDLGFDREHVVNVHVRDAQLLERAERLQALLRDEPAVVNATISSSGVGEFMRSASTVSVEAGDASPNPTVGFIFTDAAFVPTMGIEVAAGRNFAGGPADATDQVLINEETARRFGWTDPQDAVGRQLASGMFDGPVTVLGVVKDFHVRSLASGMAPAMLLNTRLPDDAVLAVRLRPGDAQAALARIGTLWSSLIPEWPFEYTFLDEELDRRYRRDRQTGQLFGIFAGLAILIGCLGLFGLASYTAEQRTKEIGVRKVMGASVWQIVLLLSKQFTRLVLVAFVLAAPLAYVGMNRWLDAYAYRVEISWRIFLIAGLAAFAVAFLTVGYQAVRAALLDPARTLRYE